MPLRLLSEPGFASDAAASPEAGCRRAQVRIDRRWLPLNALRAFEAVASHLSFTAGARALNVTQSALSRHVLSLETLLGCPLLERHPHGLSLTAAGAALLPTITRSFDRMEHEMNAILRSGGRPHRTLRVHMPPSFLEQLGLPVLQEFRRAFREIPVDVSTSNGVGLPPGETDVAVIYGPPRATDAVTDLLWMIRVTPLCAPALAREVAHLSVTEFLECNELLHVRLPGAPRGTLWASYVRKRGISVDTDRGLAFETAVLAARCAMAGGGVTLGDIDLFAADIAAGRLVAPFPAAVEEGRGYFLTFHPEDLADPAIAVFRSWMIRRFARSISETDPSSPASQGEQACLE